MGCVRSRRVCKLRDSAYKHPGCGYHFTCFRDSWRYRSQQVCPFPSDSRRSAVNSRPYYSGCPFIACGNNNSLFDWPDQFYVWRRDQGGWWDDSSKKWAIYGNRTLRYWLDVPSIRDRNVLLTKDDYAGNPITTYRGVPIKVMDRIVNTEARVV